MRLKIFDFIDKTVKLFEHRHSFYVNASERTGDAFSDLFLKNEKDVVTVGTRVKSKDSLREKIIRNKIYKQYERPQDILDHMSDIVGIMVSCRFISEEEDLYQLICRTFSARNEDGWYYNPHSKQRIFLNLDMRQPQTQKNGFPIYRIDGRFYKYSMMANFEVQIKSMVHGFWAELEHELVYKNNNYMILDGFMRDLLATIHHNLEGIDRQLNLLYNQISAPESDTPHSNSSQIFQKLLAKSINDMIIGKMLNTMGFTLDIKRSCDILSRYILEKNQLLSNDISGQTMLRLLERIHEISEEAIDFEEPFDLHASCLPSGSFQRILGSRFLELMNTDLEWNLFFHILFKIESENNTEDFLTFLSILHVRFSYHQLYDPLFHNMDSIDALMIKDDILETLAITLAEVSSLNIFHVENQEFIEKTIAHLNKRIIKEIHQGADWSLRKDMLLLEFKKQLLDWLE